MSKDHAGILSLDVEIESWNKLDDHPVLVYCRVGVCVIGKDSQQFVLIYALSSVESPSQAVLRGSPGMRFMRIKV